MDKPVHIALFSLALLMGCGTNSDAPADTGPADTGGDTAVVIDSAIEGRVCPPDSFLSWENFGQGFLLDHCTGCHGDALAVEDRAGAPSDVNFNTQAQVQTWLQRIYARSADDNATMPIADTVSDTDRVLLGDWLACGAP